MNILDQIKAYKIQEVERAKFKLPLAELKASDFYKREVLDAAMCIKKTKFPAIIAEHKRKSPSKGDINSQSDLEQIVSSYAQNGAAAISVLTDSHFFGGSNADLTEARKCVNIPLLKKDFIVNNYQIHQAKAIGADFVLLICEISTRQQLHDWTLLAHDLGLQVLIELHADDQLFKLPYNANLIGVNNRNLKTFEVDLQKSINLLDELPGEIPKIAESGLKDPETLHALAKAGFNGFLMGERFMRHTNPDTAFKNFMNAF